MKMFCSLILLFAGMVCFGNDPVQLYPQKPEPGQSFTVKFDPRKPGSAIGDTATSVTLVFSYSTFYELPWRIPMEKKNGIWETGFTVPFYGAYATFYLESGNSRMMPGQRKHYAVEVVRNGERVRNGYLYESYSLSAQLGRDSTLSVKQKALLEKELSVYPDNYEARLRLVHNKMQKAGPEEKAALRQKGLDIIAARFNENPGVMGNLNRVTMGYLIIGENSRLDSIREIVKKRYPRSEAGYGLIASDVRAIKDEQERKKKTDEIINGASKKDQVYLEPFRRILMEYYAKRADSKNTLLHYSLIVPDTTPYKPEKFYETARFFVEHNILLDQALKLTDSLYQYADKYPAGLIRYFPETGHLPAPVNQETRKQVTAKAQANSLSLKALILQKLGRRAAAEQAATRAVEFSQDPETLSDLSKVYRSLKNFGKAYEYSMQRAWMDADDTTAFKEMKSDFLAWNSKSLNWEAEEKRVRNHWKELMTAQLKKERINLPAPVMENLVDIKGNPVSPESMKNKLLIIDFWATWCVPCMKQMPYLQNQYEKYRKDSRVQVMIVNTGSNNSLQDAQGWYGNKRYSFPVFYTNDQRLGEKFGFNVIPATYVVAPDGSIQFKSIGFEGPAIERKLSAAIDLILSEQ